jgi:DNA polymerase-3 subunit beta
METQILQEKLSKALSTASRFTSTRAQLPVLGNILLVAKKNKLLVSATNLEISISISVGAQTKKEGEITVPSRVITDLIGNLPKGVVGLNSQKEQLIISAENFSSSVLAMHSNDFPSVPQKASKDVLRFPKELFVEGLSQVLFAASSDETRPVLTGVLFIFKRNKMVMVATDGFRLSQKRLSLKGIEKSEKVILPKTALTELLRLSGNSETVAFSLKKKDNQVVFGVDGIVLATRVLEGEFPDFEKIIPKESSCKVNVDKEELLRAVKLASVFARDSANVVKLTIKKASLEISAESQQAGQQKTQVDAKVEGDNFKNSFEIAFNYRFLEDFLNSIKGDEVFLGFSSPDAPGIFRDSQDKDYIHLIMPVKTQG